MEIRMQLKPGVTWEDALTTLSEVIEKNKRIDTDRHTNKHYELIKGRMWCKGNATGDKWEQFQNSRIGHRDARRLLGW